MQSFYFLISLDVIQDVKMSLNLFFPFKAKLCYFSHGNGWDCEHMLSGLILEEKYGSRPSKRSDISRYNKRGINRGK